MGATAAAILAFFGAVFGALLTGVVAQAYKRHQERHGIASAIGAEIGAILELTKVRDHVDFFRASAAKLRAGQPVTIPDILARPIELDPIITSVKDRIGVLGGDLPGRVVSFYSRLMGIRLDVAKLADGKYDTDLQVKAAVIEEDLELWNQTATDAHQLCVDLAFVTAKNWLSVPKTKSFRLLLTVVAAWAAYAGIITAIDRAPFLTPEYGLLWERSGIFLLNHIFGVADIGAVLAAIIAWGWGVDLLAWILRE